MILQVDAGAGLPQQVIFIWRIQTILYCSYGKNFLVFDEISQDLQSQEHSGDALIGQARVFRAFWSPHGKELSLVERQLNSLLKS